MEDIKLDLTVEILSSFAIGKTWQEKDSVNALDFNSTGEYCITSSNGDTIRMLDCVNGK